MQRAIFAVVLGLLCGGMALAAEPLKVQPWVYDPDNTGVSEASWNAKIGLPDNNGKANQGLYLSKMGSTSTNAAAGAEINFFGTLTELGFDFRNDSHCGAGAPRFNVYTTSGVYYFYGCMYGVHTPVPGQPNWTRVRFAAADGFASDGSPALTSFEDVVVTGIDIVFDEGTDVGVGYAVLDNIDINGTLIGKPGAAK